MRVFGAAAQLWSKSVRIDPSIVVAGPDGFAAAVAEVIRSRERGEAVAVLALIPDPRRYLFDAIYGSLAAGKPPDVHHRHVTAFANGNVQLDGKAQREVESGIFDAVRQYFRDLWALADVVYFRSAYERELAVRCLGTRPTRTAIFSPINDGVPSAPGGKHHPGDAVVAWAVGVSDAVLAAVNVALADIRLPLAVVTDADDDDRVRELLSSARVIVSLSEDPGVACALASYGRPLAAASPGAAEFLAGIDVFDPYDPTGCVDAVLRALASPGPMELSGSAALRTPFRRPVALPETGPLVTIVVTVYDRLGALEETLAFLQRQTYQDIEIVVVSNNGPDASRICAKFANVRYIHRETNTGTPAAPRNDGIAAARGTYITCLDDDDGYFPDHIARMVAICEGGVRCVYSDFIIKVVELGENGTETLLGYDLERGDGITAMALMVINRLGYMTVFSHREIYERLGSYDDDDMQGAGEVELWLRIAQQYPIAHSDQATSFYTIRHKWRGSLTAHYHARYASGFENMYKRYPATNLPAIEEERRNNLAELRANAAAPPRLPRYPA